MKVYKLKFDTDNFSGFLYELNNNNYDNLFNKCVRYGEDSKNLYDGMEITEYKSSFSKVRADCSYLANAGKAAVINEKAKRIFDENVQRYLYYIPVYNGNERLYITYTKNIIDALDYDKSIFKSTTSGIKMKISKYAFCSDKVNGEDIFMIFLDGQIHSTEVFVSERMKEIVENNGLSGLVFQEIWCNH